MNEKQITEALEGYTAFHSHYETNRNYISLSHCHLSIEEIIQQYENGFPDRLEIRLKCYKGYQMERDLVYRISTIFGSRIQTGIEISAFGGMVQGHPDFAFDGYPADCKSVLMDNWIPNGYLPRKVFWQMQGYMLYSKKDRALVVYESRESGLLKSFWIESKARIWEEIDQKMKEVIRKITK